MISVDLMSLWAFVCSVHLCFSVRKRTHLRVVGSHFFYAGYFFLSQSAQSSRSFLAHCFEPTEGLRHTENTERYCQRRVLGDGCWVLMIRQRGIRVNLRSHHDASSEGGVTSVITPLSIRRGAGGKASRRPSAYREHRALLLKVGWKLGKRRIYRVIKNHYIVKKETSSK